MTVYLLLMVDGEVIESWKQTRAHVFRSFDEFMESEQSYCKQ